MKITDLLAGKEYFYIMHLSWGYNSRRKELWDFARQKGIIGLDHSDVLDDWPKVRETVKENLPSVWINQFDMLCEDVNDTSMKNGDIVVVMAGLDYVLGIGMVIGPHRYDVTYRDQEQFFDHVRPVEWMLEYDYGKRKEIPRVYGFNNTLSRVDKGQERWSLFLNIVFTTETSLSILPPPNNKSEILKKLADIQTKLTKETTQASKYNRSRELIEGLKQLYNYRCQLCSPTSTNIPRIPMKNGNDYVEVHHIKGFSEVSRIEGVNQENADYTIDNYRNVITACVYHHKLLHKHKNEFSYDANQKCFISKDKSARLPLVLNEHL